MRKTSWTRFKRVEWGRGNPRQRTSEANWRKPLMWDQEAQKAGERRKVFCASLADVFDPEVPEQWRSDVFAVISRLRIWIGFSSRNDRLSG